MLYQLSYRPLRGSIDGPFHLNRPRAGLQELRPPADLLHMAGMERRRQRRVEWRGSVRLVIPGRDPVEATISDISEIGCGMRTGQAVEPGSSVGIDGTGFYGNGIVRFCYPRRDGYQVGVELIPVR